MKKYPRIIAKTVQRKVIEANNKPSIAFQNFTKIFKKKFEIFVRKLAGVYCDQKGSLTVTRDKGKLRETLES